MSRSFPGLDRYPVAIIGGGLAGLAAAFRLQQKGLTVRVFEASNRPGGTISSRRVDGHVFEDGPTTVMSTAEHLGRLIDDVGLRQRAILSASISGRRLVWRKGRLHSLPEKPPQLLTCTALSLPGRLRLMMEPLIPARKEVEPETLEAFGHRRLGREATAGLLDPFVSGIYAGRLDRLGVDAFNRLQLWERGYGSLFKALMAQRRAKAKKSAELGEEPSRGPAPLISFPEGLQELPRALGEAIGAESLALGEKVVSIGRVGSKWRVVSEDGAGAGRTTMVAALIVATPADVATELLEPWVGPDMKPFGRLESPHLATVGLGFKRSDVAHSLDAFGLLCAGDSRLSDDVLGVLFVSSIFPGRCPDDEVTLTTMIGGSRDPGAAELDDSQLADRALGALRQLIGVSGRPIAQSVIRWPRAIPQYPPGHSSNVELLRSRLRNLKGIQVAGNWLDGVGLESTVASANSAVDAVLSTEWTHSSG